MNREKQNGSVVKYTSKSVIISAAGPHSLLLWKCSNLKDFGMLTNRTQCEFFQNFVIHKPYFSVAASLWYKASLVHTTTHINFTILFSYCYGKSGFFSCFVWFPWVDSLRNNQFPFNSSKMPSFRMSCWYDLSCNTALYKQEAISPSRMICLFKSWARQRDTSHVARVWNNLSKSIR